MSELQQAVERRQKLKAGVEWIAVYAGLPVGQANADLRTIEDAYLSQHAAPGDDGEAIDGEWLNEVATKVSDPHESVRIFWFGEHLGLVCTAIGPEWQWHGFRMPNGPSTRGGVRTLCAALEIPLK